KRPLVVAAIEGVVNSRRRCWFGYVLPRKFLPKIDHLPTPSSSISEAVRSHVKHTSPLVALGVAVPRRLLRLYPLKNRRQHCGRLCPHLQDTYSADTPHPRHTRHD